MRSLSCSLTFCFLLLGASPAVLPASVRAQGATALPDIVSEPQPSDEGSDDADGPIVILPAPADKQADLKIKVRDFSATLNAKGTKTVAKGVLTLINSGNKTAKNVEVAVYLSVDATFDADSDFLVKTVSIADYGYPKLARQSRIEIPLRVPGPAFLQSVLSGRYVILVIDPNQQAPDSDRANNEFVIGPLP